MKSVSVIVLNWNGKEFLEDCISSVLRQTYSEIEVLVIDNASTDGSVELLRQKFPQLKLIENLTNEGFCKPINQGIKISRGYYVVPLNFDVILTDTFVEEMVKAVEIESKVGSAAGKLLRFDKTGDKYLLDSTGHIIFRNRLAVNRGESEPDNGQYNMVEFVFGTSGAAPLYKREMLEDIKVNGEYYDETFFAFWEDIDLDWRAQLRGWRCAYTPSAVAYHQRGGPQLRRSKIVELHNYKNRYLVMLKNDTLWSLIKVLPQLLFTELLKGGALLVRCPSALLGWFDLFKVFPETIKKRRLIQTRRTVNQQEFEEWFQSFDYFKWIKRHLR